MLDKLSQELESNSDLKSISSWVRRLISSNRVKSEDWYWVIESSQNVDMKTWFNDQSNERKKTSWDFWWNDVIVALW